MRNECLRPDHFSLKNLVENFPKMGLFWANTQFFFNGKNCYQRYSTIFNCQTVYYGYVANKEQDRNVKVSYTL